MSQRTEPESNVGQPKYVGIHGVSVLAPMSYDKYNTAGSGRSPSAFTQVRQGWRRDWGRNRNLGDRNPKKNQAYANMSQREYELM